MQTSFTEAQRADPEIRSSEQILRACVHCGFCTATCPTYVLLGDENDSPRGRIYMMREMLQNGGPPPAPVVKHIDRCLSCLACMTTCPSGVNYMHLVDHARRHIAQTYRRPWPDRALRALLGVVLPRPALMRPAIIAAALARPAAALVPRRLRPLLALAPRSLPRPDALDRPGIYPAQGPRRARVALLAGCAQRVLAPAINAATIRLLTGHGVEVVVARGAACCGALNHHLGQDAHAPMQANIAAWMQVRAEGGLDAVIINASGCGTTVKDYGHIFRDHPSRAEPAGIVSALACDISEFLHRHGLAPPIPGFAGAGLRVAYHAACSLQHGQQIRTEPKDLLRAAGFDVLDIAEGHLCCGSAGTYNILQPDIATALRDRKIANIARTAPDLIATGNIGCITQIAGGTSIPVVHSVELLDWATGGPMPAPLAARR